jgi:hypothetical protein
MKSTRFAKIVFIVAGIWGFAVMTPLYFAFDLIGRTYPPPLTHPDIYYGFVGVTLVWQFAFFLIATNPARYRLIMIAAVLEKLVYVATLCIVYMRGEMQAGQLIAIPPDLTLGILFIVAFLRTESS